MMMNNTTVHDVNTLFLLQESLRFRLQGSVGDIGSWGHEYVRNLAGEIGNEFQQRQIEEQPVDDLMDLVKQIVPFHVKHNAEPEAVDLLMEVQKHTCFSWNVLSFEGRSHPCS
jgi:26S proteasome regulatory subunit N1